MGLKSQESLFVLDYEGTCFLGKWVFLWNQWLLI